MQESKIPSLLPPDLSSQTPFVIFDNVGHISFVAFDPDHLYRITDTFSCITKLSEKEIDELRDNLVPVSPSQLSKHFPALNMIDEMATVKRATIKDSDY